MKRAWWVWVIIFMLQACRSDTAKDAPAHVIPDSISRLPVAIEADTAYLQYLDSVYEHKLFVQTERESDDFDQPYHYVPLKFDFTGDGAMDYLKLSSFDHRFVMGHIIDGGTGEELNEWDRHYGVLDMDSVIPLALIFNRPDHEKIETRVVDVNCGDNRKELLVICDNAFVQMGGPVSYCAMFRFDQQTQSIKAIFEHTIEYHDLDAGSRGAMDDDIVNYLDILYEDKPCIDSIRIWKAYALADSSSTEGDLNYKLIRPDRSESKLYLFNNQENTFEEAEMNIGNHHN